MAPNSRIGLPAQLYGDGSYVALYELGPDAARKTGSTSFPEVGEAGTYAEQISRWR